MISCPFPVLGVGLASHTLSSYGAVLSPAWPALLIIDSWFETFRLSPSWFPLVTILSMFSGRLRLVLWFTLLPGWHSSVLDAVWPSRRSCSLLESLQILVIQSSVGSLVLSCFSLSLFPGIGVFRGSHGVLSRLDPSGSSIRHIPSSASALQGRTFPVCLVLTHCACRRPVSGLRLC